MYSFYEDNITSDETVNFEKIAKLVTVAVGAYKWMEYKYYSLLPIHLDLWMPLLQNRVPRTDPRTLYPISFEDVFG